MSKDYLFALITGLAYFLAVIFVTLDVSSDLGESITEQRYFVLLLLGSAVFGMMIYYLIKNQRAEEEDDSEEEFKL